MEKLKFKIKQFNPYERVEYVRCGVDFAAAFAYK